MSNTSTEGRGIACEAKRYSFEASRFSFKNNEITLDGTKIKGLAKLVIKSMKKSSLYKLNLTVFAESEN